MPDGVYEDGVFYYGAAYRPRSVAPSPPPPVVGSFDADAPDELNARRFFRFTDHEPLDVFMLRARYSERKNHPLARTYFELLKHLILAQGNGECCG